jgi:hypothetical protein
METKHTYIPCVMCCLVLHSVNDHDSNYQCIQYMALMYVLCDRKNGFRL